MSPGTPLWASSAGSFLFQTIQGWVGVGCHPVIDLSNLNRHLVVPHFQMETAQPVKAAILVWECVQQCRGTFSFASTNAPTISCVYHMQGVRLRLPGRLAHLGGFNRDGEFPTGHTSVAPSGMDPKLSKVGTHTYPEFWVHQVPRNSPFVCEQHYGKTHGQLFLKFSGYVDEDTRNNLETLGMVCSTPCIQGIFLYLFQRSPCLWATLWKNRWMDFLEIFRKVRHETRKDLKHFWDVAVNSLDARSIFLFSGSLFVSNIMEKRLNGFSWNFHDTTQVYI